ncbi:MAG: class I mannose-6-phosphate isomerase [Treponema sp.]|nr:class I mannose-6-phosphate isomerase [Treponema sp.]
MLALKAIKSDKIWGYELWIASTHPNGKQDAFEKFCGGHYPLLVKVIQANDKLSVQIHPDDATARLYEGENACGKTECWYVLDAEKDARLVCGLNGVYTASELRKAIKANSIQDCLNYVSVKKGDFIYIPSGTVHAIGGGLRLLEVQQSCDITYRFFDWGRGRECHEEKAIACIKDSPVRSVSSFPGVFSCPYFTLEQIFVEGQYEDSADPASSTPSAEDFTLLFIIEGSGSLNGSSVKAEEIYALEAGEEIKAEGDFSMMRIVPQKHKKH